MENVNTTFWDMMLFELSGNKFNNYGLNVLAQTQCGEVLDSKEYTLLTDRLYIPTKSEVFASL
jgi:hypothetical protein